MSHVCGQQDEDPDQDRHQRFLELRDLIDPDPMLIGENDSHDDRRDQARIGEHGVRGGKGGDHHHQGGCDLVPSGQPLGSGIGIMTAAPAARSGRRP